MKELEDEMSTAQWKQEPEAYREARIKYFHAQQRAVENCMELAKQDVGFVAFIAKWTTASFLLPVTVKRVAVMLNRFLSQLLHQKQKESLSLKDPEKCKFAPQELLNPGRQREHLRSCHCE